MAMTHSYVQIDNMLECKNVNVFLYHPITNLSTKYLMMCKVYTNVGGIK